MNVDVAVIGAGIAGLVCAQKLRQAGYSVVVIEKSRGVGGRIATRRIQGTVVDHGARYLEPTGSHLQQLIQTLCDRQLLTLWTDHEYQLVAGVLHPPTPESCSPRYAAPAGMTAIAKFLATGLEIWFNRRAIGIKADPTHLWELTLEPVIPEWNREIPQTLIARSLVITIPAPQALDLLRSEPGLVETSVLKTLEAVKFDPCLSLMAGYAEALQTEISQSIPAWSAIRCPSDSYVSWIGWDSQKRSQPQAPVLVIQSSARFATPYLETNDLQPAAEQLLSQVANLLLPWLRTPLWQQVHRWRYAFVSHPYPHPYLQPETPLPLILGGDWCGGSGIEQALHSGLAIANQMAQLHGQTLSTIEPWNLIP